MRRTKNPPPYNPPPPYTYALNTDDMIYAKSYPPRTSLWNARLRQSSQPSSQRASNTDMFGPHVHGQLPR